MLRAVLSAILFLGMGLTQVCFAGISLSVNPVDGSSALRFDRTSTEGFVNKKEIRIRINSGNGTRYQVFQRVIEPLVNEKGESLNLQAISTQTLPNSNSYGTLYLQNSSYLGVGDQLIYSSAQNGSSDAFIIAYSINQSLVNTGGKFRGRLSFTVQGMGNASSDQMTIDVFLETTPSLNVTIKGAHHANRVHIKDTDTGENRSNFVSVSFSGNGGQEIKIYQELESMPQNDADVELGSGVLQIDPQGSAQGLQIQGPNPLEIKRTLIYSGNKGEDNFNIYFLVNADLVSQQDAGKYKGKIKYVVETEHGKQEFPIEIKCDISPVFNIQVTPPPEGLNFPHVVSSSPYQQKQVQITVLSNLHKPYQVIQGLQAGMTNKQGKEFDNKYFNMQVVIPSGQKGQTDFKEFTSVQTGESPIFSSDAHGSGAVFTVVYRLQGYAQMSAGDFSVPIRYSLNQK